MTFCNLAGFFRYCAAMVVVCGVFSNVLFAQGPSLDAPRPSAAAASVVVVTPSSFGGEHKFWDKQNRALFMLSGAMNTADFAVTRANLQNGGRELNPMVRVFGRSTPGLAVNFTGETVGVIGLSYFFHKTGHHKLERIVSVVNIGSSATAVGYGLAHR